MTLPRPSAMPTMITFAGRRIELTPDGMIWMPDLKLLCAADLHFEKGSFFSRFATLLPPYDSFENLQRLRQVVDFYRPEIFVAVGDSFHDAKAGDRLTAQHRSQLNDLVAGVTQWHWLAGNHDPRVAGFIDGERGDELRLGGMVFRHQTVGVTDEAEISGHYHPKLRLAMRGHSVTGACFARQKSRLILPSFGYYTGGLDIHSDAFTSVMPTGDREIYMIYDNRVFAV